MRMMHITYIDVNKQKVDLWNSVSIFTSKSLFLWSHMGVFFDAQEENGFDKIQDYHALGPIQQIMDTSDPGATPASFALPLAVFSLDSKLLTLSRRQLPALCKVERKNDVFDRMPRTNLLMMTKQKRICTFCDMVMSLVPQEWKHTYRHDIVLAHHLSWCRTASRFHEFLTPH